MNGWVNVVLYFPRYMMIAGITVLALAFCLPELRQMDNRTLKNPAAGAERQIDPERGARASCSPGLMAAFMSNFAATINSAPAYLVNDIYKRFINPGVRPAKLVGLSRLTSVVFLVIGIVFGVLTTSINEAMMWLVGALYGGFVVANLLKWYWWRFNGYGYFWGMVTGIGGAMVVPKIMHLIWGPGLNDLYTFPLIFLVSLFGSICGTLATEPEDEEILKKFYKTVNPWGCWGHIREKVIAADPAFVPNRDMVHDLTNVAVGIVWQLCLVTLPIYIVLQQWTVAGGILVLLAATSIHMKFRWYDRLEKA
jgi:SSS family solute:Na+ symporter